MYTIFLSSTFNDMQNERDAFHRVILPHVNGTLAEYGQSAQLCDLRWGVDTSGDGEAESTRKILDVCFDSIRTSIPFFVVMLGDRYGWVPPADVSGRMEQFGLSYHAQSVTEMEIEYHDIASSTYASHAIYLFRDPIAEEEMTDATRRVFRSEDAESREKLQKLKDRIRRENPGRVFSYSVDWDAARQNYSTEAFAVLAAEKLDAMIRELLGERPILTTEEKVLQESIAYFTQHAHLACGNMPVLQTLFKDLFTQVHGSIEGMNEELREAYEKAGELERIQNKDHWDPFSAVLLRPEACESSLLAGIYEALPHRDFSKKILPVPFVAGISEHAQNGEHLLACLVRAIEKELLTSAGIPWTDGDDMREKAKALIEYDPWERFPEGTALGLRYYLEQLLKPIRKSKTQIFLFVEHFERMTDTFAHELQFLTASGSDNGIYLFFEMTEAYYAQMTYIRTRNGHFAYHLLPLNEADRTSFIKESFAAAGKSLTPRALEALVARPEGENVTWLKAACESLSDLDSADFARIRGMGDGIGAIEQFLLEKIRSFPAEGSTLICERLLAYGETLTGTLAQYILGMLSLTEYGVSQALLERIAAEAGAAWNGLDFALLLRRFPYDIRCSEGGLYSFFREDVRDRMHALLSPDALLPHYVAALQALTSSDAEYATECISLAARIQDADWLWQIIDAVRTDSETHTEIYYRLARALAGKGEWLIRSATRPIPEACLLWVCKEFFRWMEQEDRARELLSLLREIAAYGDAPDLAKMNALSASSEYLDRDGDHAAASREFAEAFAIAERIRGTHGADAIHAVSYYAYLGIWYHPDEKEKYATVAYEWACALPHTVENVTAIVLATYYYIRICSGGKSIREINDLYQSIFELYEELGPEVCYTYKGEFKRNYFYDLHLRYVGLCAEICDRYAAFLSRNYKRAGDLRVPYHDVFYSSVSDGDFYVKVDGLTTREEVDFSRGAIRYRGIAIRQAGTKHSETHGNHWAMFYADCCYRQAEHKKKIGQINRRVGEAYESYEDAARGYEMALRAITSEEERQRVTAFRADAFAGMADVAKNFARGAYQLLCENACTEALSLYESVPLATLSDTQRALMAQTYTLYGKAKGDVTCYQKAFAVLQSIRKESARLYFDFFFCLNQCKVDPDRKAETLTVHELHHMLLTYMSLARHYFYGESEEGAKRLYAENESVKNTVRRFLSGSANALAPYINGFCMEHAYCTACGDTIRAEVAYRVFTDSLAKVLTEEQMCVFRAMPAWEGLQTVLQEFSY